METNAYLQGKATILQGFTVKGFKSWIPKVMREGVGAQATLYKDGKKIGLLIDQGQGGQVEFRPDGDAFRAVVKFLATLPMYEFKDLLEGRNARGVGWGTRTEVLERAYFRRRNADSRRKTEELACTITTRMTPS